MLGIVQYNRAVFADSRKLPSESRKEIESLSRTALRLDPHLVGARALLASLALQFDWDWKGAEQEYREALAGGPNATVSVQYAMLLCFEGRFAEADQQLRNAQSQDPVGYSTLYQTALIRLLQGRFAESREVSQRLAVLAPASLVPAGMIANAYLDEHKPDLAAPYVQKVIGNQAISTMKAELEVRYGHPEEALRIIRSYEDQYPNPKVRRSGVAIVYAALNDEPNTIKWLNRAADDHEMSALNAGILPVYQPMRRSDGFRAFLRRIHLDAN
jgi:Tfp pilus assembly protein PilF